MSTIEHLSSVSAPLNVVSGPDLTAAATNAFGQLPRVLLVDDHYLLLEALTFVMVPHYEVLSTSSLGKLDVTVASFRPDVVVIDITMPDGDGIAVGQRLARKHPGVKLIFLSMHTDAVQVRRATEAGAHGFVSKKSTADELMLAISTVLNGGRYHTTMVQSDGQTRSRGGLTDRQTQVLRLVARGLSAKEIATELNISVRTAEFHRGAIMQRLNMHSTALLTRFAVENGLV